MLKHLLPILPKHTCYVEPFAGGLALLLAKPRSKVEVINDLNGDLVGLYRVVQYHLPELQRELEFVVSSRAMLKGFCEQKGLTDVQRAARFLVRYRISFGSNGHSFAVAKTPGGANFKRDAIRLLLGDAHDRLSGVTVENISWEHCVKTYDSPETFFFFDPPYICPDIDAYESWKESDLRGMAKILKRIAGRWILTFNDCPIARELFAGYPIQAIHPKQSGASKTVSGKTFNEVIIQSWQNE